MRQQLEHMADQIEMILARNESPARVTGGVVTPRAIRFDLSPALGTTPNRVRECAGELAEALGLGAVRVFGPTHGYGALAVEVIRADAQPVILADMLRRLPAVPFGTAVLGICDDGAPLLLRLPSPDVGHVLIVGEHGAELMHTIITSLTAMHRPHELQVVTRDTDGMPHALNVEPREIIRTIESRLRVPTVRPLIIVALADVTESDWDLLITLTRQGQRAGVHIIGCARDTAVVDGARFGVRLVGQGEPDYFAAESGAGVVNFTAARVQGGESWNRIEAQRFAALPAARD